MNDLLDNLPNDRGQNPTTHVVIGVRELVRGEEQGLLRELKPLVQSNSVSLDLNLVERIDAAGLATLISLSCEARKAGHALVLVDPSRRVARMLALVGLDRMVATEKREATLPSRMRLGPVAA